MRFWGKILCSGKDYYVAEGITSNENADILPKDAEKKGDGANTYTFWVSQDSITIIECYNIKVLTINELNSSYW